MTHKTVEKYILSMPNAYLDYPFGEEVAVYKVGQRAKSKGQNSSSNDKMFALIQEDSKPVKLSLKCDPELSKLLRERYESVMEGYHLNKKHWITVILSSQLSEAEIEDLIRHSYHLVAGF